LEQKFLQARFPSCLSPNQHSVKALKTLLNAIAVHEFCGQRRLNTVFSISSGCVYRFDMQSYNGAFKTLQFVFKTS